ncbi:MAG: hypothetical protein WCL08_00765 [Verrucomicrobiota bacterium]
MNLRFLSILCIGLVWRLFSCEVSAETVTQPLTFPIGKAEGAAPAAQVTVEKVVQMRKKQSMFRPKIMAQVACGIAVRFEQPSAAAFAEIPAAVRALGIVSAKSKQLFLKRLAIFAPGDPVPRLMADEALVDAKGEWILKRALFADRRGAADCRLVWGKDGEAKFTFPKGNAVEFNALLAERAL